MKVAFITDRLLAGGKERRLIAIIHGLIERDKIQPILILWDGLNSEESIFYKNILDLNIPIYYLGGESTKNKIKSLYHILRNEGAEVINTWAPPVYSYYLLYAQVKLRIPVYNSSITCAGSSYSLKQKVIAHSLHYISRIVNSNTVCALEVFNIPKGKRKTIYNGFDFSRIAQLKPAETIRSEFDIQTKFIVSMAARYCNAKDWPTHIKAAVNILEKGYNVSFLCMGAGDSSPYTSLIPSCYKDRIKFIGCQTDVESIFAASDIVTLSTIGEGISNSILEGMAVGKPIVATKCGGNPEIIADGISGYLTGMYDCLDYANKIMVLLDNPELRKMMGESGLEIVKKKFNIEQMISGFEMMLTSDK